MTKRNVVSGRLIVFEGPDGVGKSTISRELSRRLQNEGINCELLAFPGRFEGTHGSLVDEIHHDPEKFGLETFTPASKQALHLAALLDTIERRVIPALRLGTTILLDRYWWSTWAYGLVDGVEPRILQGIVEVERRQWRRVKPALVVLVRRSAPFNRNEPAPEWNGLRVKYDELADRERNRYPVLILDNSGSIDAAVEVIRQSIAVRRSTVTKSPKLTGQLRIEFHEPVHEKSAGPTIISHILPVRPTVVYDTYWWFAAERQRIFFKRLADEPQPWTSDPIFARFKFTNAYRASDRTSQYLIRKVIYRDDLPRTEREVFFRTLLFRVFNKIGTWKLLETALGPITYEDYSFERFDRTLNNAMASGKAIYSAAYIMPPAPRVFGYRKKHQGHLALIERMIYDNLPERVADATSMQQGYELLHSYPTIGDFLAYQYITDLNYSEIINFCETEFVVPGPGAVDGIRKCFVDRGGLNEPEIIKFMADRQEQEFMRLGLDFQTLWGRPLQLIDCQNLFCEVDKYSRIRHPEVLGKSRRTRIKQKYQPHPDNMTVWYPPKWRLNELIQQ